MQPRRVYRTDLNATLHAADARRRRSKQRLPGASEVGECRRRTAYRLAGQVPDNLGDKSKAIEGTIKHKVILPMLAREHGGYIEVGLLDPDRGLAGSCDWVRQNPLDQWIVTDLKTYGKDIYEYRVQQPVRTPVLYQKHLYGDLLRRGLFAPREKRFPREPLPIAQLELIERCRDDARSNTRLIPYRQAVADEAWAWLADVKDQVEEDGTAAYVPRDLPGPDRSEICRNCPFAGACWGWDPDAGDNGERQPLTLSEAETLRWLQQYKDAADQDAASSPHKKAKELARAHLDGLPAQKIGTDGWELRWKGGNDKYIEVMDEDAAREKFIAAGIPVPMKVIHKRTAVQIDVRRPPKRNE